MHSLPKRFVRIRHFGFLSNRLKKNNIQKIRNGLGQPPAEQDLDKKSIEEIMLKLTGVDITSCPCCKKGTMRVLYEIPKKMHPFLNMVIRPPHS